MTSPVTRRWAGHYGLAVVGAVFGLAWFFYWGGRHAIDPTNLDWIIGDHSQHLLGWLFFRDDPWTLPLGSISSLMYPVGTTVGFTDANPWVALLLKPLSPWLPADFQFIGPWLALCFALQGMFGARIMEALTSRTRDRVLGTALFVLAPPMLQRVPHDTLTAHWLVLGLIWLHVRQTAPLRNTLGWAFALNVIAAGVHPYLAMMLVPLTVALLYRLTTGTGQLRPAAACACGAGLLVAIAGIFLLLGYLGSSETLSEGGFGFFSADTLAFFNSMGYSRWLPSFSRGEGQYEGFGFLGSGVLGLALVLAIVFLRHGNRPRVPREMRPLVLAATLTGVFALSKHVTIAGHLVLTLRSFYDPLAPIVEPMRSSGRFIWPLHYVVLTGILALVVGRNFVRPALASTLLAAAIVVQVGEVEPRARFADFGWRHMQSPAWEDLSSTYRHLVLYPGYYAIGPPGCQASSLQYPEIVQLSYLAYRKDMTFNSAYVARASMARLEAYCQQLEADVTAGRLAPDAVYVVEPGSIELFTRRSDNVTCGVLDGFNVCVSNAIASRFRRHLLTEAEAAF